MQHAANNSKDHTDQDSVLKSTLVNTVAALMLISTLFVTAFASIEASASPAHGPVQSGGPAHSVGNDGHMVSVGYLA